MVRIHEEVEAPEVPLGLKPYSAHGLDLRVQGKRAIGDCPFCGKADKFSVNLDTGQAHCFTCTLDENSPKGGLNPLSFIRKLWEVSFAATTDWSDLAADRGLLHPETLEAWGVARSVVNGEWLVPAYDTAGKLHQLHRYTRLPNKKGVWSRCLPATPGVWEEGKALGLFGGQLLAGNKLDLFICEGPWDAMALWEALKIAKLGDEGLSVTGNEGSSLAATSNVIGIPGVKSWQARWNVVATGKRVFLPFDNDHPKEVSGQTQAGAGLQGMERTAKVLTAAKEPPAEVNWLRWGDGELGHNPGLKSGHDLRDSLKGESAERVAALAGLLAKFEAIPEEWVGRPAASEGGTEIKPLPCRDWKTLVNAWQKALYWRRDLGDGLAVMLAIALSKLQRGNQLFLQLLGDAGSAKTLLCEAMLVSKHCILAEHITGFHSGWKSGQGEDYSFIARANGKVWITPEGDTMMSSPHAAELMSQTRRIFDGATSAGYKTLKEDRKYPGLRTPWIMAATPAIMDRDQARLGDRFLRFMIDAPDDDDEDEILNRAAYAELESVKRSSNCAAGSIMDEALLNAYRLTGGYVDWLAENAEELIGGVAVDDAAFTKTCRAYARFTAALRARPSSDKTKEEEHDTKELPTRLTRQYVRLASCLAPVLGYNRINTDVMRIVRKVAIDTARGRTLEIARALASKGRAGMVTATVAGTTGHSDTSERRMLYFLQRSRIGVVEMFYGSDGGMGKRQHWRLTDKFSALYDRVTHAQD